MTGIGPTQRNGSDIADFAIGEREILRLPLTGVTRDANNRISQTSYAGVNPSNGLTYTITRVITRDAAGRISTVASTFTGGGNNRTETWTVNRDANSRVTTIPVART